MWQNLGSGERVLYSLYGIVEHSGSMRGGHYAAYVKVRTSQRKPEQRRNHSGTMPPKQYMVSMLCVNMFCLQLFLKGLNNLWVNKGLIASLHWSPIHRNLEDAARSVKAKRDLFV